MAIDWTPARLEVDLNYKSKDIVLASEWNNLWKETRLQGNNNTDGIVLLIETVEGNVTHLTNLDNLFADLESKVTAHTGNSDIHVTSEQKTAWTAKYDKPSGGIPKSDLATATQSSLDKADTALQQHQDISALTAHVANNNVHVTADNKTVWNAKYDKPADGIPKTDLASVVQSSLNKADTALQEHQDISDLVLHTENSNIHVTSEQKTAWDAKYDKPTGGIPKSDLASAVQTSLGKADTALQEHQDISALTNHVTNNSIHVTTDDKTAWNSKYNKPSGGIPKTDLASDVQTSLVPSSLSSDSGKVLTVSSSGDAVWAEATSSGSSGADVFNVVFTQAQGSTLESKSFTADKTYAEIVAAHEAGKIVRCSVLGAFFGQLSVVHNNYVAFGADSFSGGLTSAKFVFIIYSDNEVKFSSLYFYTPVFSQEVISAAAWSNGVYSFESVFPNAYYDIEIELDSTATEPQVEAWSNAKPTAVFGTNTMKALGDVPTVDIPVIVKILFNANQKSSSDPQ